MSTPKIPPASQQIPVLLRGVADAPAVKDLQDRLTHSHETQKPLVIKAGFDPTAADLHLGHTVLIEKMAQFQRFGHDVVFLVGDYTARIGDPTGRNSMRPPLSDVEIKNNAATYTEQCFKILDRERTRIEWNSSWLQGLAFADVIGLLSRYNLGRMMERRDFKERFEGNKQIAMHELVYPLIQGYDSVVLKPDVELGGHDQIFNLNVGRHLMEAFGHKAQMVMTVPLLTGLDGVEKMSKSKGNHVGVLEEAENMFGKVMSISDDTMWNWIPVLLGEDPDKSKDPLVEKKRIAHQITARFTGQGGANRALSWWDAGRPPLDKAALTMAAGPLFKIVMDAGAAASSSDARRKIAQGGVSLNGERHDDPVQDIPAGTYELRVGKKFAASVTLT